MVEQAVGKASDFYMDLFTVEWQKMVLPVLMVLILSASALSTMDLKNSDESEQLTELSLETMSNLTEAHMKTEYFKDSINQSQRALSQEISDRADERRDQLVSDRLTQKAFLGSLQRLGFFPYTPELDVPNFISEKDYLKSLAEVSYRQEQFESLGERLNSSENISLAEFEEEVQRIKSVDWRDEEVKNYLRNYSQTNGSAGMGGPGLTEEIRQKIIDEDFSELSFTAYLPSLLATFLIYYVVNAVAVQSARKAYGQIKRSRRREKEQSDENETGKSRQQEETSSDEQKDSEDGQETTETEEKEENSGEDNPEEGKE
jgi:hypothetical protein